MVELETLSRCLLCGSEAIELVDPECNIARCRDCEYVFDNPRPTLPELVKFYSGMSKYDSWLDEIELREVMWKRRLKLVLPFRKPGSLLDIGAGIGQFLSVARPYYEKTYGTEVSTSAIQIAKKKYGVDLFQGTIEEFARSGKVFDNISLIHVLEHVPDPVKVIRLCHSLLSDDGVLVVAVPNDVACLRHWKRRKLVAAGFRKPYPGAGQFCIQPIRLTDQKGEVHLSHFTPRVLANLLRRLGFEVIKNTPDPHYLGLKQVRKLREHIYYNFCVGIEKVFGTNLYDTMLTIAKKKSSTRDQRMAA